MSVEVSRHGPILVVEIAREEKRNALTEAITAGIDGAMNDLEDDRELRCAILTEASASFRPGPTWPPVPVARENVAALSGSSPPPHQTVDRCGGGPGARRRPRAGAVLRPGLSALRAERLGFVNVLTEPGSALAGALVLAEVICANAPVAIQEALGVVNAEVNGDETASWERSDSAHTRLLRTADMKEGIAAFFERRLPKWTGR
jgi:enoyl-CoA hydratase